jgi:hypothetical protein
MAKKVKGNEKIKNCGKGCCDGGCKKKCDNCSCEKEDPKKDLKKINEATSLNDMTEALSKYIINNAEKIGSTIFNIAPYGKYEKILEGKKIIDFLKSDVSKSNIDHLLVQYNLFLNDKIKKINIEDGNDNWKIKTIQFSSNNNLYEFVFASCAIDDGDVFFGYVFVDLNGKIKHIFTQSKE